MPARKKGVDSGIAAASLWLESPYLARVASRVARQRGLPEDELPGLLQDLRVAVWEAGVETRLSAAWVFGTATHKAIDRLRRRARARRHDQELALSASPRERDLELQHLLHTRVAGFPKLLRRFYDLHYTHGFSEREVALSLGVSRATVRWLNRRCLRLLSGLDRYSAAGAEPALPGSEDGRPRERFEGARRQAAGEP